MRSALIALGFATVGVACGVVVDIRGAAIADGAAVPSDASSADAAAPPPIEADDSSSSEDASARAFECSALSPRTFDSGASCASVEAEECAFFPDAGASVAASTGSPCDAGVRVCACALASTGTDYVLEGRDCRCAVR